MERRLFLIRRGVFSVESRLRRLRCRKIPLRRYRRRCLRRHGPMLADAVNQWPYRIADGTDDAAVRGDAADGVFAWYGFECRSGVVVVVVVGLNGVVVVVVGFSGTVATSVVDRRQN